VAYCTLEDMEKALPSQAVTQLTDDEGDGTRVQERVDEAIAKADGEIDTYLGGRYAVPLSSVPEIVRSCSVDISVYHLYKRKVEEVPPTRDDAYRNALRVLREIRDGKMKLPVAEADTVSASGFAMGIVETSHFEEEAQVGGAETC
jgi:phage gp36-like protein